MEVIWSVIQAHVDAEVVLVALAVVGYLLNRKLNAINERSEQFENYLEQRNQALEDAIADNKALLVKIEADAKVWQVGLEHKLDQLERNQDKQEAEIRNLNQEGSKRTSKIYSKIDFLGDRLTRVETIVLKNGNVAPVGESA